jgi:hypothetical protein
MEKNEKPVYQLYRLGEELHIFEKNKDHIVGSDCWCKPELEIVNGKSMWNHRDTSRDTSLN